MTIIYNKRTGVIKGVFSGDLQTMDVLYGGEAQDYKLIWSELVIPDDDFVIQNPSRFVVNVETLQLEMKPTENNYPIKESESL